MSRNSFEKACGRFTLYLSDPSPRWATISVDGDRFKAEERNVLQGFHDDDLRDLRFLIDRALGDA